MFKVLGATAVTTASLALACYAKLKMTEALNVVGSRVTSLQESSQALLKANNEAREAFRKLEEDMAAVERRLTSVEANKEALERHITSVEADKEAVEHRLSSVEADKAAMERRLTSVEAKNEALEQHINSVEANNRALERRLTSVQENKAALERRLTSGEEHRKALEKRLISNRDHLEKRLASVEKKTQPQGVPVASLEAKTQAQEVPVASLEAKTEDQKNQALEKNEDTTKKEPEMTTKQKTRRWETVDSRALSVAAEAKTEAKKKNQGPEKKEDKPEKQETRRGGKVDPKALFVGAIPQDVNAAQLAEYFEKKFGGRVQEVRIKSGKKKYDYGFMFFDDKRTVQRILRSDPIRLPSHDEGQNLFVEEMKLNMRP